MGFCESLMHFMTLPSISTKVAEDLMIKQKINYLFLSSLKRIVGKNTECPSCESNSSVIVSTKYLVTQLRRCNECQLLFRTPTTTVAENNRFYQEAYREGLTTDMPSLQMLEELKKIVFVNTEKDFSRYIKLLELLAVPKSTKLLDYGCSWGYGSWQFTQKGYQVKAFEISQPRAAYARKYLGVDVVTDGDDITDKFDVIFSSHVLEHVPSVSNAIEYGFNHLRDGGLFIAFTPNGSNSYRDKHFASWQQLWGLKHPNFLDENFYKAYFSNYPNYITSSPYDEHLIRKWAGSLNQLIANVDGPELLVIVQKSHPLHGTF